mgnify:CR=1 FL=1
MKTRHKASTIDGTMTTCGLALDLDTLTHKRPDVSYVWSNVTCPACLKCKVQGQEEQ